MIHDLLLKRHKWLYYLKEGHIIKSRHKWGAKLICGEIFIGADLISGRIVESEEMKFRGISICSGCSTSISNYG